MLMNLNELSKKTIESTTGGKKMRLSENAASMVFQLFTKNVYSNPIGTIVREITSNCFDSHIEAGVDSPVIIRLGENKEENSKHISFIDFGVGMSPDRVENIYGVYFESTKRSDNEQIGGFGIGGKTPLAYKRSTGLGEGEYDNSFFVITIYNNVKYYYCVYEGNDSPVVSLLHQEETKEINGTEVRIPILAKDMGKFISEIKRQLYYFENIVFEGFEDTSLNNYQIIRANSFLFRGGNYSTNVHICLGRVAYPIDYNALGLSSNEHQLPVAIRLNVGDANVTVSRESIDYSESTIKMIKDKLNDVKAEILEMLTVQYEKTKSLEDYFKVKTNFGYLYFPNGVSMYVGNLIKQSDVKFRNFAWGHYNMPSDKDLFTLFFRVNSYGKLPKQKYGRKYEFQGSYKELSSCDNLYYSLEVFTRKIVKQAYVRSLHSLYHLVYQRDLKLQEINDTFNLKLVDYYDDKGNIVPEIKNVLKMQKEYFKIVTTNIANYDTIEVPQYFIDSRRRGRNGGALLTDELRKTTLPIRIISSSNSSQRNRVNLGKLFDTNAKIFWGTTENETQLQNAVNYYTLFFDANSIIKRYDEYDNSFKVSYNVQQTKNQIIFMQVATNNAKFFKHCKNAFHVKEFGWRIAYRKEDMFRKYFQLDRVHDDYNLLDSLYKRKEFAKVDAHYGAMINEVNDAVDRFCYSPNITGNTYLIKQYCNIKDIKVTLHQQKVRNMISKLVELQKKNEDVLKYINVPYALESPDDIIIKLLKKVMVFK